MSAWRMIMDQPVLRMLAGLIALLGAHNAAVYPYLSLIAVSYVGLSEAALALVMALASVLAVSASVLIGILGDQRASRRRLAIVTAGCAVAGSALMLAMPGPFALVVTHGILLPVGWSIYGQAFGLAGLVMAGNPVRRDGVQAVIRAGMSATFLALLIFFTFAFADSFHLDLVYACGLGLSLALFLLVLRAWPEDGTGGLPAGRSGLNMLQSFAEIARPPVLLRMMLLGAVTSAGVVYMVLVSLVFEAAPGRSAGDVALYVGMVAGWEVPFMLLLPRIAARVRRTTQMAWGTAVYVSHLALMPVLADSAALWLLPLLAGLGGAAILTLPIGYYQDLMQGRPGAASALIALQKLVSDVVAALIFGLGMTYGGHLATALTGAGVAVAGALALHLADRRDRPSAGIPLAVTGAP
ncbi:MAG: hypothetical protein IH625_17655 [Rhodobacteraceae bacterium]|nr:hypothetical protein [Paracoccaceae bacterium]